MKTILFTVFLVWIAVLGQAKDYRIRSAKELEALVLAPGDRVLMEEGDWKDQKIVFKGNGSKTRPIVLMAANPGKTLLTGSSSLVIDGTWLLVDGLSFANGFISAGDVIGFSDNSSFCRLTNTAVVDYNPADEKVDYRWVSLRGSRNRVDHCFFKGKRHQGVTLIVWLSEKPNYHQIDHNYFGPRPELGRNGGETIRIGTSTWSFHDSFTIVEENIFEHCDGELEAVSNKSCRNIIRNNLFYECKATLTLRHGNHSEVSGNFFLGNGKPKTGGVRIIGEDHLVQGNYFQDLTGTSVSAAISVMAGLPNPILTSHWQVKNAVIQDNLILNCTEPFAIAAGYNPGRYLPALNTVFAKNIIMANQSPLKWYDEKVSVLFEDNLIFSNSYSGTPEKGFVLKNEALKKMANGLYLKPGQRAFKPFWEISKIGPGWAKLNTSFPIL
ncbi:polysaccharide lyase 6 family protein [Pedobacter sp. PLR]|uniref:polysaccharide lyase 6 family protein n=1 Tax=Pedobacter sp. PLR TaxID=2994465 RepID=UPI0022473818|nr:polysaccharide lyase 6 family protein [Pedobacter sp. PLR]MCX2450290.1 polysaccharide lyase 6 family protein [Pedobacter sp. PLR]